MNTWRPRLRCVSALDAGVLTFPGMASSDSTQEGGLQGAHGCAGSCLGKGDSSVVACYAGPGGSSYRSRACVRRGFRAIGRERSLQAVPCLAGNRVFSFLCKLVVLPAKRPAPFVKTWGLRPRLYFRGKGRKKRQQFARGLAIAHARARELALLGLPCDALSRRTPAGFVRSIRMCQPCLQKKKKPQRAAWLRGVHQSLLQRLRRHSQP